MNTIWDHYGTNHEIGKRAFIGIMTLSSFLGILISLGFSLITYNVSLPWWGMLGLFILMMMGTLMASEASDGFGDNVSLQIFGYLLMTSCFGLLLGPVLALYTAVSVVKILGGSLLMVGTLGLAGAIYPKSLENWGIFLLGALLLLLVGQFGALILAACGLPVAGAFAVLDWVGLVVFSGLVMYDFNRAMRVERNLNSAIGCAVSIYLDFMNIFIRLLSLFGAKRD